jgi:hypothetical protein
MRPSLPPSQLTTGPLMNVIRLSWDQLPSNRPSFEQIARDIKNLRAEWSTQSLGAPTFDSPKPPPILAQWEAQDPYHPHHSPDILPPPLPSGASSTGHQNSTFPVKSSRDVVGHRDTALGLDIGNDEARSNVHAEQGRGGTGITRSSSISTDTPSSAAYADIPDQDWQSILASGFHSPLDPNTIAAKYQNERRYRMLLQHDYHTIRRVFIPLCHYCVITPRFEQSPSRYGGHLASNLAQWVSYRSRTAVSRCCSMHSTLARHQLERRTSCRCCPGTARFLRVPNVRTSVMLHNVVLIASKGYFPLRT